MHTALTVSVTTPVKKESEAKMGEITERQDTTVQGPGSCMWASPLGITTANARGPHYALGSYFVHGRQEY